MIYYDYCSVLQTYLNMLVIELALMLNCDPSVSFLWFLNWLVESTFPFFFQVLISISSLSGSVKLFWMAISVSADISFTFLVSLSLSVNSNMTRR